MKKSDIRQCQPCTGCCDGWLQISVEGEDYYPGKPCIHSTGSGCDAYTTRPQPCIDFRCAWIIPNSPLPDWMKPSNSKAVVVLNKFTWRGVPVDLAVPVGKRIPPRALNWLKEFAEKHARPLVYTEQIKENGQFQRQQTIYGYGPAEFREELANWSPDQIKMW
jgi:hypothetical protein